jgi:hypothetical protein
MLRLKEFLNDPPTFLRRHHLIFKGLGPEVQGGATHDFLLIESHLHPARRRTAALGLSLHKATAGLFEVRARRGANLAPQALERGEVFQAVWGGYKAGTKISCALVANGPDLMLTPELTGCTIAFATQSNGTASFSHYNLMDPQLPRSDPSSQQYGCRGACGLWLRRQCRRAVQRGVPRQDKTPRRSRASNCYRLA